MNQNKETIVTACANFIDLQAKQMQLFQNMINFLMDEEGNGKEMEANQEVVERLRGITRDIDAVIDSLDPFRKWGTSNCF